MEQTNLVPKRRFKEFQNSQAWEQSELSELAKFTKGSGYTKLDLREAGSPIILYGRLYTDYETVIEVVDTFVDRIENSVISLGGEVVVPSSGESAEDIARASVVGKPGIVLGGDLNIIKPNERIDPVFLALAISNGAPNRDMVKRAQGKSVVHLHNSDLKKINLVFPQIDEQRNIAEFNLKIDRLITLHQRKLEKAKALKSAFLTEMFPAEGEREPKRRFEGFIQDWEQHKLGELLELENGYAFKGEYFQKNTTKEIVLTPGNVNIGGGFQYGKGHYYDVSGIFPQKFIMKPGDIFVTMTDLTPSAQTLGSPAIIPNDDNVYLHNQRIGKLINYNGNKKFLFYLLCTEQYHKQIVSTASGTTVKHSSPKKILDCLVSIPSIEEQEKIGNFFKQLDDTITLHQRKLEKLQNLKKAYLNEMFV